jgi:hypothetical protein
MSRKWDYEGEFLNNFEPRRRSLIANMFCNAVRDGAKTIDAVIAWVDDDASKRLKSMTLFGMCDAENESVVNSLRTLQELIALDSETTAFVEHILWRETLTCKQIAYLKSLGCPTEPQTKFEASQLIEQWLKKKAA